MKKLVIICILMLSLVSCSSDNVKSSSSVETEYYGKWTLVKITGNFVTNTTSNMAWKETYIFNTDGTFSKTKTENNTTITAVGTFKITTPPNETLFELNYKESSSIVESCNGHQTENLHLNKDNTLASDWQNCDGWGLIFKKE
ncbi:hypothetical protein [Flavobacterium sp.]|uniref:hypothetical protein n=1 Tax=Flavobacterium sp. TaxID=239 RepID=UPI003D106526